MNVQGEGVARVEDMRWKAQKRREMEEAAKCSKVAQQLRTRS